MKLEFRMPDIGEGIAEVEILEWHVSVGDDIREDQIVATIETDKSVVEMPSPLAGKVVSLGAQPGDFLPVGNVLLVVDSDSAQAEQPAAAFPQEPAASVVAVPSGATAQARAATGGRPKASPAVRRFATEQGVALNEIEGTGPDGRITREDVLTAASGNGAGTAPATQERRTAAITLPADFGEDEHVPLRGLRRQIARNMIDSWRNIPHITDYRDVDATRLVDARRSLRDAQSDDAVPLTYLPFFVKAVAVALRQHPIMNASLDDEADEYVLHRHIHVGIATATKDGLLVPVVKDADGKSIAELAAEIAELVELARTRKATRDQLTGGTYTVNNLGALGASIGTPIIRRPEVGIMGFGRIADRVVAIDGAPAVRPMLSLSSVGDHRLHDGDTLGAFTTTVAQLLENPFLLLAELR